MKTSNFIKPIHPKSEILPTADAISTILDLGWVGQMKVHGHRAQIHMNADDSVPMICYTRQGRLHSRSIPLDAQKELRRIFAPQSGWTILDVEWLKSQDKFFVFDVLKWNDQSLSHESYHERYSRIPRNFLSPHIVLLPFLKDLDSCLKCLESSDLWVEGIVLKSLDSKGFLDSSVVKCRKRSHRY